ncbi:MAG: minichromosome maintenance protein MCM [Nitrososphaerota archaeon]|nr:minichromosome maintenance protein MCM [Nitrososphaerota archaeon]
MAGQSAGTISDQLDMFLRSFKSSDGSEKYIARVDRMIADGQTSVRIDYEDLLSYDAELATSLIANPDGILHDFKDAALQVVRTENIAYADRIEKELEIRITGLIDKLPLRGVSARSLDRLVALSGMVVRTSEVKPKVLVATFRDPNDHATNVVQLTSTLKKPERCAECDETKNFELDTKLSRFTDYQSIRLQELPEELPPGQLPQSIDAELLGDLVNRARPGDRVVVTGVVRADPESAIGAGRQTTFRTRLETNDLDVRGKELEQIMITPDDEAAIRRIAESPTAYEDLIKSVSPSIYGFETQKEAALLVLVGAPQRSLPDQTTIRGDLNLLLVGDPGTAKSELLKYVARLAPRGLYTTGRGSTAAGLTAAVVKEKSGLMMLEAGAVVLADLGVACIDEFDKMRPEDRGVLHEVMEQQTVSVAKGGIVATLNARTSILAAANPLLGRYDPYKNIYENVNLPIPLLTRFDTIFIVRDNPDRTTDERLATHILETHRSRQFIVPPPIEFDLLRKYIAYAKKIEPLLLPEAESKLLEFYLEMRGMGAQDNMITVTPRQLEALVRLATARARVLLRDKVTEEDALQAISIMRRMLGTVGIDVKTGKIDIGVIQGRPSSERTLIELAMEVFKGLQGPERTPVQVKDFVDSLEKTGKFNREEARKMVNMLYKLGQIYEIKPDLYSRIS